MQIAPKAIRQILGPKNKQKVFALFKIISNVNRKKDSYFWIADVFTFYAQDAALINECQIV